MLRNGGRVTVAYSRLVVTASPVGVRLFRHLPSQSLGQEEHQMFSLVVDHEVEIRPGDQIFQQSLSLVLVPGYQRLTGTLLPAVAVGRGGGPLQFTVVVSVAGVGTLRTAAERASQSTGAALENILVDVFVSGPCEGACVIVAQQEKGIVVGATARRVDELLQREDLFPTSRRRVAQLFDDFPDGGGCSIGSDVEGSLEGSQASVVAMDKELEDERSHGRMVQDEGDYLDGLLLALFRVGD